MIAQLDKEYIKLRPKKLISRLIAYLLFEGRPYTTRGQWINPFVFFLLHIFKTLPKLKNVKSPIYIIGIGRSGTTILGKVLSMHPQIGYLNEPKAIWASVLHNEDLIGSYHLNKLPKYHLDQNDISDTQANQFHKLYGAFQWITQSNRVLDKYPELVFRIPAILKIFPDAKFIFLIRNGNDTCKSIDQWSQKLGKINANTKDDWWGRNDRKWEILKSEILQKDPYFKSLQSYLNNHVTHSNKAALEWIATMRMGIKMKKQYPESILDVKYEELTENADVTLTKMLRFCNLNIDQKMVEYGKNTLHTKETTFKLALQPDVQILFNETSSMLNYN
ncbi:MAG: sulfotransferase [Sphingobacteriaceae bacterium]|nr:sulfotransferase [Sphingobacteriaceae bacterium]